MTAIENSTADLTYTESNRVDASLNDAGRDAIMQTQLTESYPADGVAPTLEEALMLIQQFLGDFEIDGTDYEDKWWDYFSFPEYLQRDGHVLGLPNGGYGIYLEENTAITISDEKKEEAIQEFKTANNQMFRYMIEQNIFAELEVKFGIIYYTN